MAYSKTDYKLSDGTDLIELFKNPELAGTKVDIGNVNGAWVGEKTFTSASKGHYLQVSRDGYGRLIGASISYSCSEYVCSDYGDSCCNECDAG